MGMGMGGGGDLDLKLKDSGIDGGFGSGNATGFAGRLGGDGVRIGEETKSSKSSNVVDCDCLLVEAMRPRLEEVDEVKLVSYIDVELDVVIDCWGCEWKSEKSSSSNGLAFEEGNGGGGGGCTEEGTDGPATVEAKAPDVKESSTIDEGGGGGLIIGV